MLFRPSQAKLGLEVHVAHRFFLAREVAMNTATQLAATSRASPSGRITGTMEAANKAHGCSNYPNPFN